MYSLSADNHRRGLSKDDLGFEPPVGFSKPSSSSNKKISLTPKGLLTKSTGEQLQLEINKCYLMDRREIGGEENTVVKITGFSFPSDENGILYRVSRGDRWSSGFKRNERIAYLHPRIFDSLVETVTPVFDGE